MNCDREAIYCIKDLDPEASFPGLKSQFFYLLIVKLWVKWIATFETH